MLDREKWGTVGLYLTLAEQGVQWDLGRWISSAHGRFSGRKAVGAAGGEEMKGAQG